jgi:hypothetical protein
LGRARGLSGRDADLRAKPEQEASEKRVEQLAKTSALSTSVMNVSMAWVSR